MSIQASPSAGAVDRGQSSSLADVLGTILDKGIVVDIFARVSLVGIELLRVDVRVVIASVDTYLRFAEAANRLEMGANEPSDLTSVVGAITGGGSGEKDQQAKDEEQQGQIESGDQNQQQALDSGARAPQSSDRSVGRERQPARRAPQEDQG